MNPYKRSTLRECLNVLSLLLDLLVNPAIIMAIWNHVLVRHVVVSDALPPIGYSTAICVRLLVHALLVSNINTSLLMERHERRVDQVTQMYQAVVAMHGELAALLRQQKWQTPAPAARFLGCPV